MFHHFGDFLVREIRLIYRRYKKISDGCDGKCVGFGGSLSPKSLDQLFQAMNVFDCRFVDLGAGDGRVLVAVLVAGGAKSAVGYELPGNFAQKFIYSGVLSNLPRQVQGTADIVWKDIDEMLALQSGSECVFSFWVGMPYSTQVHILYLAASCSTVDTVAVFRDHKWSSPELVLKQLQEFSCGKREWYLSKVLKTAMFGSGEKKTAWVFHAN